MNTMRSRYLSICRKVVFWIAIVICLGIGSLGHWPVLAAEESPPSEGWIAFIGEDGNVWLVRPDGNEETQVTDNASDEIKYTQPKWTPAGEKLAYIETNKHKDTMTLIIRDIQQLQIISQVSEIGNSYDWSPDGTQISYQTSNGGLDDGIKVYDLQTEQYEIIVNPSDKMVPACSEYGCTDEPVQKEYYLTNPSWSPSGKYLIYIKNTPYAIGVWEYIEIADISTGEITPTEINVPITPCDWHPIEDRLVCINTNISAQSNRDVSVEIYNHQGTLEHTYQLSDEMFNIDNIVSSNSLDLYAFNASVKGSYENTYIVNSRNFEKELTKGYPQDWSPDDEWLLVQDESMLYVVSLDTGERYSLDVGREAAWQPDVSDPSDPPPLEDDIAYIGEDGNVWMIHLDGSGGTQITTDASEAVTYTSPAWSYDGMQLYFIRAENEMWDIRGYDYQRSKEKAILSGMTGKHSLSVQSVSPDGQGLVFVHGNSCLATLNLADGSYQNLSCIENDSNSPPASFISPGFSPSGDEILVHTQAHENISVQIFTPGGGSETTMGGLDTIFYGEDNALAVSFSSYHSNLIPEITDGKSGIFLFDRKQQSYSPLLTVEDDDEMPYFFSFSKDGRSILYQIGNRWSENGEIIITDLDSHENQRITAGHKPAWRPTVMAEVVPTDLIAYIGEDKNVWVIQSDGSGATQITFDAGEIVEEDGNPIRYGEPKWSPDGKKLGFIQFSSIQVNTGEITYTEWHNQVYVYDLTVGKAELVLRYDEMGRGFDWFVDSGHLIYDKPWEEVRENGMCTSGYSTYDGLYVLDLDTMQSQEVVPTPSQAPLYSPNASPTGEGVIFKYLSGPPFTVLFPNLPLNMVSLQDPNNLHSLENMLADCDWSPDGKQIACASWNDACSSEGECPIHIFSADGELVEKLPGDQDAYDNDPLWSPDGSEIAFHVLQYMTFADGPCGGGSSPDSAPDESQIVLISLEDRQRRVIQTGHLNDWSPDGESLVIEVGDYFLENRQLKIVDITHGNQRFLVNGSAAVWQPAVEQAPPPAITDLQVEPAQDNGSYGAVQLNWTEPGTSSDPGPLVAEYDLRTSEKAITEDNWDLATKLDANPIPANPGEVKDWIVVDPALQLNTQHHFAIRSRRENSDWSALSNVPILIDSGLRSQPDGYQFTNLDERDTYRFKVAQMREMFGDENICVGGGGGGDCEFTAQAERYFYDINSKWQFGVCFGMAATSQLFYFEDIDVSDLQTGTADIYSLDLRTEAVQDNVANYQVTQYAHPVQKEIGQQLGTSRPRETFERLYEFVLGNQTDPLLLLMFNSNRTGGHAVTPLALSSEANGWWKVWVYNSRQPGQLKFVEINPESNLWRTQHDAYYGDADTHNLFVMPLSMIYGQQEFPPLSLGDRIQIWSNGIGHILISNKGGSQIGYRSEQFVNEIPGASAIPTLGDMDSHSEPIYDLPADNSYTILLDGQSLNPGSAASLSYYSPDFTFAIEPELLASSTNDKLTLSSDGSQISYQANEAKEVDFSLSLDRETSSEEYQINGVDLGYGDVITIQTNPIQRTMDINHANAGTGVYDLTIIRTNTDGEEVYSYPDIEIAAGSIQTFELANWDRQEELIVLIDLEGDGQVDEEMNLSNQADPAESGDEGISRLSTPSFLDSIFFGPMLCLIGMMIFGVGLFGLIKDRL